MGLYAWFCRRSCWRACRSGWFSTFWINSRTLVCFTTECGSPGIRKSMSASFTIIFSWLILSWSITSLLVLSCAFSTLGSLLFSDERAWITLVSITGLPVLSEETDSSWKELTSISWERDVFLPSCTVLASSLITGLTVLSRLGLGIGGFDWKLLDSFPASARWAWSEPNSLFHSFFKEIFGGGRGDMKTFSKMTSPVSILTTFGIQ